MKAAQCIGDAGEKTGIGYEIRMIDTKSRPEDYEPDPDRLLGIMAPTIGAIQPMSFFGFILRLPKGNGQKAFLASTGAWTKVGPVFLPGYVGFGLYLAALFLMIKGFQVVGINGFGMPHNWTTLIPAYSRKLEKRINEEIRPVTERFTLDLLSGKRVYKRIGDLIFTILIFPLPFLFILLGHLFSGKDDVCRVRTAMVAAFALKTARERRSGWSERKVKGLIGPISANSACGAPDIARGKPSTATVSSYWHSSLCFGLLCRHADYRLASDRFLLLPVRPWTSLFSMHWNMSCLS